MSVDQGGHTLGFGWESLNRLYNRENGLFHEEFVKEIPELAKMKIELDYGPSTRYAHWDEETFTSELMTGLKGMGVDHVLPVTIKIMKLFGHQVIVCPKESITLDTKAIKKLSKVRFNRQKDVSSIDTLYERKTAIVEEHNIQLSWWEVLINLFK